VGSGEEIDLGKMAINEIWLLFFLSLFQPTVEQFISMNRDINDGKDLPVDMLRVSDSTKVRCCTCFVHCVCE
jgi:hypothetical protein